MSVQQVSDVAGYAAAVRRALVGLGPEQVEDLTDGLEADLAEAMADESIVGRGADPVTRFGTPEEYAAELGAAAGLGPVPVGGWAGRFHLPHPARAARRLLDGWLADARRTRWWPPVEGLVVSLRPVWWVLRGWVVWQVIRHLWLPGGAVWLPRSLMGAVPLVALVVASVQWGRGRWPLPGRWRTLGLGLSAVAAVLALPLLVSTAGDRTQYVPAEASAAPWDGVWAGGARVSNLFVYDAAGNPLSNVQIYDDRGDPVVTTDDRGYGQWDLPGVSVPWSFVGVQDVNGQTHWNVYPHRGAPFDQFLGDSVTGERSLPLGVPPQDAPRPFDKTPALALTAPTATPAATPAPPDTPDPNNTTATP